MPRILRTALLTCVCSVAAATADEPTTSNSSVVPRERPDAVLHNPDMGWVLYENYPLDQDPNGSSTMLLLPKEDFATVDAVALMFSWQDVERRPDEYDFSNVDYAYDYWAQRGKEIQLRLSTTTLLWWSHRSPPAGAGAPNYVLEQLAPHEKQTRELQGIRYVVEDSRNAFYRQRLAKFLHAVGEHFNASRPVTLIDLRGFGVWGEWHSGFQYSSVDQRRDALKGILDIWSEALPNHQLALSYSYDPDGPKELYAGPTNRLDEMFTAHYAEYVSYSAFGYALTKPNIAFRRDGCGGAVHSNERKFNEEAFRLGRGPMFSEFMDGYGSSKTGGSDFVRWKIEDALSLHPNYINVLGYQGGDMQAFMRERPDLVDDGLRRMGYRLVPTSVTYPTLIDRGKPFGCRMKWVNRGVGRALRDYELQLLIVNDDQRELATATCGTLPTSHWVAGQVYPVHVQATVVGAPAGDYQLAIRLFDRKTGRVIALPLKEEGPADSHIVGPIKLE